MSDKINQGINKFKSNFSDISEVFSNALLKQLQEYIDYQPVIGIMGKTGAGKSSLINALFQSSLSSVSDVEGGTRYAQRFTMSIGNHFITFIDLPGIGENAVRDQEYHALYQELLPELDFILWVLKADDRAWSSDENCYQCLTEHYHYPQENFLFVLNQADKIEPCREWDLLSHTPSQKQLQNLNDKSQLARNTFNTTHPVITVSSTESYQLSLLAEQLVMALPIYASSSIVRQLNSQYRSEYVNHIAREDFGLYLSQTIDTLIDIIPLPSFVKTTLSSIKSTLISSVKSLWDLFF